MGDHFDICVEESSQTTSLVKTFLPCMQVPFATLIRQVSGCKNLKPAYCFDLNPNVDCITKCGKPQMME